MKTASATMLNSILRGCVVMFLGLTLVGLSGTETFAGKCKLVVGGTGSALGAMSKLAAAYMRSNPGSSIEVLPSLGSSGGIRAITANRLDIALTARPLKDTEKTGYFEVIPYAKTPIVLATPKSNPANGLTTQQLVKIVAGEITKWPDGTLIGLVIRQRHDSETRKLKSMSPEMPAALEKARNRIGVPVGLSVQNAADLIQNRKGGLGTSNLSVILAEERPLKSLSLDGIEPTEEAILSGRYKYVESLSMIITQKADKCIRSFVEFVRSPEGAQILRKTGHAVLKN